MRRLEIGQRVDVYIPKGTALGALCDEEGFARRRRATVVDPQDGRGVERSSPLVRFEPAALGTCEVLREWVR